MAKPVLGYLSSFLGRVRDIMDYIKKPKPPYELAIYNTLQRIELQEHEWYFKQKKSSEHPGREWPDMDVINDWNNTLHPELGNITHAQRFHKAYFAHRKKIEAACRDVCGPVCKGFREMGMEDCFFAISKDHRRLHQMLED